MINYFPCPVKKSYNFICCCANETDKLTRDPMKKTFPIRHFTDYSLLLIFSG